MFFLSWYLLLCVLLLQEGNINALVRWPDGSYGLLQPNTGCPTEHGWQENAWVYQDTLHNSPYNKRSESLHIKGKVSPTSVKRYFCIKTSHSNTDPKFWPKGQYCIYNRHQEQKKHWGRIRMYGWRRNNKDTVHPKNDDHFVYLNSWYDYIDIHFFCKTEGCKEMPIELPTTKPFYLLPYGSRDCQQVKWMVATSEWIKYHTRNYEGYYYYYYYQSGTVPHHELGNVNNKGITMYYCYYQSCNHTLTNRTGVFQSPRFPGKYPDGQLCSWRIMVPANHTVHVHFTNLSLYEYDKDCLQVYENDRRTFKPKQAFFGRHGSFNVTASSDLLFVFRSDEENNSTGFRAHYQILRIPERTTTASPKPTTTTAPPTTQKPTTTTTRPTTKLITTKPPTTNPPTTKQVITKKVTTFTHMKRNDNSTTSQERPFTTNYESSHDRNVQTCMKEACFCDETWKTVVMVLPLAFFILIVVVVVDLFYRCRSRKSSKTGTSESVDDGIVINPKYERGDIVLDHTTETIAENDSTPNTCTVDDKSLSHDELPDYEDVDYTQLNEMKPPNMKTRYPEYHALEPVGHDAPEMFYHVLEPLTDLNRPTYQNLSEMNHYTLNPLYDSSAQNPAPLVEENKLYVQYSTT